MKNIFLVGFMGVGKSTLAPLVAQILSIDYIDLDVLIEERLGLSIPEIFKEYGEAYFREIERKILDEVSLRQSQIIACGGGILLREENISLMRERGKIIYLFIEDELWLSRLEQLKNRPLLAEKSKEESLQLKHQRELLYEMYKDDTFRITTDYPSHHAQRLATFLVEKGYVSYLKVVPSQLVGSLEGMDSKSYFHRALIVASLMDKTSYIRYQSMAEDVVMTLNGLKALGAKIEKVEEGLLKVTPIPKVVDNCKVRIDCGQSGSTLRFLLPVAAVLGGDITFEGAGRLPSRPIEPLVRFLEDLGIEFDSHHLPFRMKGQVSSLNGSLRGDISSQFYSGLLMAKLRATGEISIVTNLVSKGYVEMTRQVMEAYQEGLKKEASSFVYRIPKDYSSAAFWIGANLLGSRIEIRDLKMDIYQGDSFIEDFSLAFETEEKRVIDLTDMPDLAPILCVVSGLRKGQTVITNIHRLRDKESDRIDAIVQMMKTLGGQIEVKKDSFMIQGVEHYQGGYVNSFGDHRMIMAAAIAATRCHHPIFISDYEEVSKSYPDFFVDYQKLGGKIYEF